VATPHGRAVVVLGFMTYLCCRSVEGGCMWPSIPRRGSGTEGRWRRMLSLRGCARAGGGKLLANVPTWASLGFEPDGFSFACCESAAGKSWASGSGAGDGDDLSLRFACPSALGAALMISSRRSPNYREAQTYLTGRPARAGPLPILHFAALFRENPKAH